MQTKCYNMYKWGANGRVNVGGGEENCKDQLRFNPSLTQKAQV